MILFGKYHWWPGTSYGIHEGYDVPDAEGKYLALRANIVLDLDASIEFAQWCWDNKINLIVRPYNYLEPRPQKSPDWHQLAGFVKWLTDRGMPAYIQLGNEEPASDDYVDWWIIGAQVVLENGGHPGVGAVFNQDVGHFLYKLHLRQKLDLLLDRGWWCTHHGYPYNHPWDFPHDAINQAEWPGSDIYTVFDAANPRNRASYSLFGWLDTCKLIREYTKQLTGEERFVPVISGESLGGIDDEWYVDMRYPYPDRAFHLRNTQALIQCYREGQITLGDRTYALPSEYLGNCDWILGDERETGRWWPEGIYGSRTEYRSEKLNQIVPCTRPEVVEYLSTMEPFERQFGQDIAPPKPPEPEEPMDKLMALMVDMWERQGVRVNTDDAFFKHAVAQARNGVYIIPQPSRDGYYYTEVDDYLVAYTLPPMHCRKTDYAVQMGLPFFG